MNLLTYSNVNFSGGINTINNGVQLFKPFVVNHKTLGPLTLKISKEPSLVNGYDITVSDKFKKVLGHEAFSVLPEHKMIVGQMVEVLSEYRKQGRRKGFNLGELLHLSLIKFMNDNEWIYIQKLLRSIFIASISLNPVSWINSTEERSCRL